MSLDQQDLVQSFHRPEGLANFGEMLFRLRIEHFLRILRIYNCTLDFLDFALITEPETGLAILDTFPYYFLNMYALLLL